MRKVKNLGRMCRDLRETLELTQADVAADLNVTVSAVSRFEGGSRQSIYILSWYIDHDLNIKLAMNENRCVCCGDLIPEGRQVCPKCEDKNRNEAIYDKR